MTLHFVIAAVHYTGPWYVAIPAVVVLGATVLPSRRGGGRGPFKSSRPGE